MANYRSNNEIEARPVPQGKKDLAEYLEWTGKGVYDCGFGDVCMKIPNGEVRFSAGEWMAKNSAGDVRSIGQAELVTLNEGRYSRSTDEVATVAGPEAEAVKDKEIPGARTAAENVERSQREVEPVKEEPRARAETGEKRPSSQSESRSKPRP